MSNAYQLRSQDLQKTVLRLEARNQELAQFTYIASHDLQEPLRTLTNFSGLLLNRLSEDRDEQTRMAAKFIDQAAQRMRNLVLNLLSYNRIGERPQLAQVDCAKIIADVRADLSSQIEDTETEIFAEQLPTIKAVPAEIALLFQNLISNAIKFRRIGEKNRISVVCASEGSDWHFQVCDNGIGIAEENYPKIFQIFRRLHREEAISGSGIGLASCKKVVTKHGGKIWVTSSEGAGSCFHFTLPKEPSYDQEI
jgi:light-regulated signal transduction histidine kinase (bacteriophytochrome)